ncbi:hypothetical protein Q3G72_014624 [Acer saccharum]|nr:hypothetical protein Q3G72_014624 [Acer saccharum]
MSNISSLREPYRAVTKGEWKDLQKFFDDDEGFSISYPMTVAEDNAFHIAVHSKREEPLKQFLEQVSDHMYDSVLNKTNAYENTVLHEAAINHNIKAVNLLVGDGYVTPEQLLVRNESGQTPLFKAAAFGSTKVVKYLASQPNQTIASAGHKKLNDVHRINDDELSILHAAVLGENFGTALCLLKMDKGLAKLKTKDGMTSLHLLTNSQSAFTKKYSNHLWLRLLYLCIPTGDYDNYDDANTLDEDKYDVYVDEDDEVGVNYISEDDDGEVGDNQTTQATAALATLDPSPKPKVRPFSRESERSTDRTPSIFMAAMAAIPAQLQRGFLLSLEGPSMSVIEISLGWTAGSKRRET